jgi:hypothetical protein
MPVPPRWSGCTQDRPSSSNRRPERRNGLGVEPLPGTKPVARQQAIGADDVIAWRRVQPGVDQQQMVGHCVEFVGFDARRMVHHRPAGAQFLHEDAVSQPLRRPQIGCPRGQPQRVDRLVGPHPASGFHTAGVT